MSTVGPFVVDRERSGRSSSCSRSKNFGRLALNPFGWWGVGCSARVRQLSVIFYNRHRMEHNTFIRCNIYNLSRSLLGVYVATSPSPPRPDSLSLLVAHHIAPRISPG